MIVGAGVVGTYLGKILGNQEVWEAKNKHYEKACGGLFSKNIKKLDVDLNESLLNEVKGAKFYSENQEMQIKSSQTQAYVVDRYKFEENLIQDALNEGSKIVYGKKWNGQDDDFIIGADGALSSVAKSMSIKRNYFYTYQEVVELNEKKNPDFVEVYFDDEFAPGFFGWWIPFNATQGRLGLGTIRGNPGEFYKKFSKKFSIKKVEKRQSALIPIFDGKKTVESNKALVGDAAAQTKASTGGGVIFGLLAAEELKKAIDKGDLSYYEKSWREKYFSDLRKHKLIWKYYKRVNKDKLFRLLKERKVDELLSKYGDMEDTKFIKSYLMKNVSLLIHLGMLI